MLKTSIKMIKKNNKTINEWYFNDAELIKVYKNGAICYYKVPHGTPSQEPCFAVVDDISQYSDTEFVDVYDKATEKWYKLNNLDQYEEYGIYGEGRNITYYEGKLTIDNGYEYEWDGSEWDNLGEVSGSSVPDSYVIPFADSTVKNICVSNWGGNVVAGEITYGEAKQVTSLGSVFQRQTTITSFNELAYFHGLTSLVNGEFVGCTSLRDIVIPSNVTHIGNTNSPTNATFSGCTSLSGLTILSGDETLTMEMFSFNNSYYMNSSHSGTPMCFPDRIMTFSGGTFAYCDYLTQAYFQSATPPVGLANADINNYRKLANVYCPVGSLSAYQTALSGKGKTITEYDFETDSLGLLDKEKEWKAKTTYIIVYPKYYTEKDEPENNVVFEDMEEALAYECPWVGMDVTIDNTPYLFGDAYEWLTKYGLFEVSGEYICYSGDKYEKMEEMVRNVDGTWSHQTPIVYEKGDLIEAGSTDCDSRLPDVPFILNYNAKNYDATNRKLPKTEGQLRDSDAVCSYGYHIVDHSADGYITVTGDTRMIISGTPYFNRTNTQTGCTMTIVSKVRTTNATSSYSILTNRGSYTTMNWMWRYPSNGIFLHGSSSYNTPKYLVSTTGQPITASIRISYNGGVKQQLNDWTNNGSYSGDFQYGSDYNGNNAMFCDYATENAEFWKGDFYWVYMSFNVLTDEQIQQVIDYNENL